MRVTPAGPLVRVSSAKVIGIVTHRERASVYAVKADAVISKLDGWGVKQSGPQCEEADLAGTSHPNIRFLIPAGSKGEKYVITPFLQNFGSSTVPSYRFTCMGTNWVVEFIQLSVGNADAHVNPNGMPPGDYCQQVNFRRPCFYNQ